MTRRHGLHALAPRPGERILDAACGAGGLLLELATAGAAPQLSGLDVSTAMLEQARERLPATVRLVEGHMEQLPLKAASFDAVTCFNALHYSSDPAAVLGEFRRVLTPGGRLVVVDWRRDLLVMPLLERWLRLRGMHIGRLLGARELPGLARAAGLAVDGLACFRVRPAWALMTLRAHRAD